MRMRATLAMILGLAGAALFAVSVPFTLVGIAEKRHADRAYVVGFVPGDGCGDAHELYLHVDDGKPMDCVAPGMSGSGRVRLPGFTTDQNDQVRTLAQRLGHDGLSAAEQREIQHRVDELAATVPPSKRPYGKQAVSGAGRIWLGAGMALTGLLGLGATLWLAAKAN
ncbi:hypothetical protein ACSNOI_17015 [Actinomadura kijaniata]|uniref:hypothetical protein n=1 Tax=Actinomadura kijaniata TaxID=46161 RepID=UPI003F1E2C25